MPTVGMGLQHIALNRNKKSLALDRKQDAEKDRLRRLLGGADVFIHNVRAEAIDRLGFGYDAVRR